MTYRLALLGPQADRDCMKKWLFPKLKQPLNQLDCTGTVRLARRRSFLSDDLQIRRCYAQSPAERSFHRFRRIRKPSADSNSC